MERVKGINVEIVHLNQQTGFIPYNPYAMDIGRGRNYYNCKEFGHLA